MSDNMDRVCALLEYIGLDESDLNDVYYKIHYWTFIISLGEQFEESGSLSEKQQQSLVGLILKHTGAVCDTSKITHYSRYERKGESNKVAGKHVDHEFHDLGTIQLFDLPYTSGSTQTAEFHPYNSHSIVLEIKGRFYKIPLPSKWEKFKKPTTVKFTYRRTACKGYMTATE